MATYVVRGGLPVVGTISLHDRVLFCEDTVMMNQNLGVIK